MSHGTEAVFKVAGVAIVEKGHRRRQGFSLGLRDIEDRDPPEACNSVLVARWVTGHHRRQDAESLLALENVAVKLGPRSIASHIRCFGALH